MLRRMNSLPWILAIAVAATPLARKLEAAISLYEEGNGRDAALRLTGQATTAPMGFSAATNCGDGFSPGGNTLRTSNGAGYPFEDVRDTDGAAPP